MVSFWADKNVLNLDCGDCCISEYNILKPMSILKPYTFYMGEFYRLGIVSQSKIVHVNNVSFLQRKQIQLKSKW